MIFLYFNKFHICIFDVPIESHRMPILEKDIYSVIWESTGSLELLLFLEFIQYIYSDGWDIQYTLDLHMPVGLHPWC